MAAAAAPSFRVLVSGASGMVGRALVGRLSVPSALNHFRPDVHVLVRHRPQFANEVWWDPMEMRIDLAGCEGFDAVVHLAGENVGSGEGLLAPTGRWTERKKHAIMESRRRGTQLLAQALASVRAKPRVLVSASGVGFYGSRGDELLEEGASQGRGFLADVAGVWEANTAPAAAAGVRVVNARFGVVLSATGGALAKLYWPFFLGGGGPIGSGAQWMSWVTLDDAVRAIEYALRAPELAGPVNVAAPGAVRSAEFTATLARVMHRPHLLPLPEGVVRAVFGEMGDETLLASQRAPPAKLTAAGFRFLSPTIEDGVIAALHPVATPEPPRGRPLPR